MLFHAYQVQQQVNGELLAGFVQLSLPALLPGEVRIRSTYSSVNYKDALACSAKGKVMRHVPCVAGVDVAGEIVESRDSRFQLGDAVLVTGYGMGVDHDGGFAEYVQVVADWVVALPAGLSLYEAMVLGTAGFTAALAIHKLQQNDLSAEQGEVIVTGATGGVSSLLIPMLVQQQFCVVALTRKTNQASALLAQGVSHVIDANTLQLGERPLEKARWAAAFDSVGGATLSWLTRSMLQNGLIASYGNTGGLELHTSVMPFILRGVRLIGIDSAATLMPLRQHIWHRLSTDLRPTQLAQRASKHRFVELPALLPRLLAGEQVGRVVIEF